MSYTYGEYPTQWKKGSNYRPLKISSIPRKVAESIICDSIDPLLSEVLHKSQCGYRKGLSSESLLLYLTESWRRFMAKGRLLTLLAMTFCVSIYRPSE